MLSTRLECIDIALIEATAASFADKDEQLQRTIESLDGLCAAGLLQDFGVHLSLPPFMHHTPHRRDVSRDYMVMPLLFERALAERARHCSLVLYDIAPSHQLPATYPLLRDPSDDELLRSEHYLYTALLSLSVYML